MAKEKDKARLEKPVMFEATNAGGPVKHHRLVLRHETMKSVGGQAVRVAAVVAHFRPFYSTNDPELVKIVQRKVDRGPMFGIRIINISNIRQAARDEKVGSGLKSQLIDMASEEKLNSLCKSKYKVERFTEVTAGQASDLLTELKVKEFDKEEKAKMKTAEVAKE